MAAARFIELQLGPSGPNTKTIQIDREAYSIDRSDRLTFAVLKIKEDFSPEKEFPRQTVKETVKDEVTGEETTTERDEDDIEYGTRVLPLFAKKYAKSKDESDDEFLARIHSLNMAGSIHKISFRIICEMCRVFELPELTEEEFRKATLPNVRQFLKEVLEAGEVRFQGKLWPVE